MHTENNYTQHYLRNKSMPKTKDIQYTAINKQCIKTQQKHNLSQIIQRINNLDIKINNLTNIVKLLQKYSQVKDQQYQRQKQNQIFRKNINNRMNNIQQLEISDKINQFNQLITNIKKQLKGVQNFKINLYTQFQNNIINNNPKIYQHTQAIEQRLREQFNTKIQICTKNFKNIIDNNTKHYIKPQLHPKQPNFNMQIEEQIHNIKFILNKVQNECNRNKMLIQKIEDKLETSHITEMYIPYNSKSINKVTKSRSDRSLKSISKGKIDKTPKLHNEEVREAIRRKKENKNKLKYIL